MEAWQDEMRALKEAQRLIEETYGVKLESYEDVYMGENALSSVNRAEFERFEKSIYEPTLKIIDKWIRSGTSIADVNRYVIVKSDLERNREFVVRDVFNSMRNDEQRKIELLYRSIANGLKFKFSNGEISEDEYNAQMQQVKEQQQVLMQSLSDSIKA